jgi:hypothetical protein
MRFMLTARFGVEAGNEAVSNGRVGQLVQSAMEQLKPEAAYFGPIDGGRGCYLVINMEDPSQIPAITEPLFQNLHATVTFVPVMTAEDLAKGVASLAQANG